MLATTSLRGVWDPPQGPVYTEQMFHPVVQHWLERKFGAPTPAQAQAWPLIASGKDVLVTAPTGSGKTLAAFLWALDRLVGEAIAAGGTLPDRTSVLYVSPLKALSNDVRRNLEEPLGEIKALAAEFGYAAPEVRTAVRTGDTTARERRDATRHPPHVLVTTPESLYILLTSESGRKALRDVRTVIVDEIHAVAPDKRGAHLALSLERLEALVSQPAEPGSVATGSAPAHRSLGDGAAARRRIAAAGRRDAAGAAIWSTSASGAISISASRYLRTSSAPSLPTNSGRSSTIGSPRWPGNTSRRWCSSTRAAWSSESRCISVSASGSTASRPTTAASRASDATGPSAS